KRAVSLQLPGTPGTSRSESWTVQLTDALTWAGWPSGVLKPGCRSSVTTGLQCRPSARSAALALANAARRAAAGLSEIDACRAASRAAASTELCATDVRPAAITKPIRARTTGARISTSSGALPSSAAARMYPRRLRSAKMITSGRPDPCDREQVTTGCQVASRCKPFDRGGDDLTDRDHHPRHQGRNPAAHPDRDSGSGAAHRRGRRAEQEAGGRVPGENHGRLDASAGRRM